jgi:CheY-like chemotaxis protein
MTASARWPPGFQEHVAKPYSVAQLVSAVRSVLAARR